MASLINRNGTYYGCWTDSSRRPAQRRLSLRTKDRKVAGVLLEKAEAEYCLGQFDPWVDDLGFLWPPRPVVVTLEGAQRRYISERGAELRPLTVKRYEVVFRGLGAHVSGLVPVARVRASDLTGYVLDPKMKPNTQRTRRTLLRAFFEWCCSEGLVESNPAGALRQPKHDTALSVIRRRVTEGELDRICQKVEEDHERRMGQSNRHLAAPRLWLARVFRFAYYTGLRGGELARLRWSDLDLERRRVVIAEQKSGKATVLPLSRLAVRVIESIPADERDQEFVFRNPMIRRGINDLRQFAGRLNSFFVEYRDAAGIERPITLHGLRHGFASRLAEAGASAWTVKEACRHSTVVVSQTYVDLAQTALAEEIEAAFECRRQKRD